MLRGPVRQQYLRLCHPIGDSGSDKAQWLKEVTTAALANGAWANKKRR